MFIQQTKQHLHCDQGVQRLGDWTLVVAAGETITQPQPLLQQKGGLILALEDSAGNSEITRYDINARTELRYLESRHTIALRYQDESSNGDKTRESWLGSYQYDQFFTDQWFATGNAFYEEDKLRELDKRASVGLGMGYQFLETPYFDLLGKGTLNYVDERFTTGVTRDRPAFLWNLDFAWRVNDQGVEVFHRHAALQSFEKQSDYEVNTTTGLKYPINSAFSSIFQLEYNYDNLPAEESIDKVDRKWSVGVNYDW
jgi:putative salt-induced outer membrane protein YdiY